MDATAKLAGTKIDKTIRATQSFLNLRVTGCLSWPTSAARRCQNPEDPEMRPRPAINADFPVKYAKGFETKKLTITPNAKLLTSTYPEPNPKSTKAGESG